LRGKADQDEGQEDRRIGKDFSENAPVSTLLPAVNCRRCCVAASHSGAAKGPFAFSLRFREHKLGTNDAKDVTAWLRTL
jgi:hypothetical protein